MTVAETILYGDEVTLKFENLHADESRLTNLNKIYIVSCVNGSGKNLSSEIASTRKTENSTQSSG